MTANVVSTYQHIVNHWHIDVIYLHLILFIALIISLFDGFGDVFGEFVEGVETSLLLV